MLKPLSLAVIAVLTVGCTALRNPADYTVVQMTGRIESRQDSRNVSGLKDYQFAGGGAAVGIGGGLIKAFQERAHYKYKIKPDEGDGETYSIEEDFPVGLCVDVLSRPGTSGRVTWELGNFILRKSDACKN